MMVRYRENLQTLVCPKFYCDILKGTLSDIHSGKALLLILFFDLLDVKCRRFVRIGHIHGPTILFHFNLVYSMKAAGPGARIIRFDHYYILW